jgi:Ser/Thr protein kinase RdoA (MazF antagonist)
MLEAIPEAEHRDAASRILQVFEVQAAVRLDTLRSQVIHNDFNLSNLLVSGEPAALTGIIDFGDMIHAPLVCDVATAAAYQMLGGGDPLAALCYFVARFHEVLPLTHDEIEVLFDLAAARVVLILAITHWRAQRHPENRAYILRNMIAASDLLLQLNVMSREHTIGRLRNACGNG